MHGSEVYGVHIRVKRKNRGGGSGFRICAG
jgi:hypothetical protein